MKTTANKYTYYKVLQSNSGYGWDDEVFYDKSDKEQLKELKEDRKAYKAEGIRTLVSTISNSQNTRKSIALILPKLAMQPTTLQMHTQCLQA